jgi:hypothetical protein
VAPAQYGSAHHHGVVPSQYAVAPPLYGAPAHDYGSRRRPGTVTAAAVLAFVDGGLGLLVSLFYLIDEVFFVQYSHFPGPTIFLKAIVCGVLLGPLACSALFIWGGVRALKGRTALLTVMSSIQVGLTVLGLFVILTSSVTTAGTDVVGPTAGLVFVVWILILLAQRSSKEFSRDRRRGTT